MLNFYPLYLTSNISISILFTLFLPYQLVINNISARFKGGLYY